MWPNKLQENHLTTAEVAGGHAGTNLGPTSCSRRR